MLKFCELFLRFGKLEIKNKRDKSTEKILSL